MPVDSAAVIKTPEDRKGEVVLKVRVAIESPWSQIHCDLPRLLLSSHIVRVRVGVPSQSSKVTLMSVTEL